MLKKQVLLLIIATGIISCTQSPEQLGFSPDEWQQMSQAEQQKILDQNKQIQWTHPEHKQHSVPTDLRFKNIVLSFSSGKAKFNKNKSIDAFKPAQIAIAEGSCNSLKLTNNNLQTTRLQICYQNYKLSLDPSPWQLDYREGSAFIYSNKLWQSGFTYTNIQTKGKTNLTNATIHIKVA